MRAFEFTRPIEIKFAADSGEITGYGSTFNNVDHGGDVCAAGCFTKSLAEHKAAGTMPAMLWGHDASEPVGVWTEAAEDQRGLKLKGKLTMQTQRGAEARALAKDGALALSIGYRTRDAEYDDGARILRDVKLFEVSLVGMPMNDQARILSVKSAAHAASEIRDAVAFERFLKANGFASRLARRLAAGWNSAVGRPEDDEAAHQLAALLEKSAALIRKGKSHVV
jgi:HK97 family phage prohead protease